mmetsp:Transcript_23966/g.48729  ORF Transcript_23966/g.48729 Transcript_23966/m.48729 type:complete len:219 (-) Transcript_23966:833-1489(-)
MPRAAGATGARYGGSCGFLTPSTVRCPQPPKVTNSSAMVGWMATDASKSARVAPMRTATAKPCIISSEKGPMQCSPTTVSSGPRSTSFSAVLTLASAALSAYAMLENAACLTVIAASPNSARAAGSVSPMVPMGGWLKTTVAMLAYSILALGSPPKSRSARRRPAAMATGVSSNPEVVQSPSANTEGEEVFSKASTLTSPASSTSTPALPSCSVAVTG